MNKFTRDEQISAVIKSNLVSFNLTPNEIRTIVEQATSDIVHVLEHYQGNLDKKGKQRE